MRTKLHIQTQINEIITLRYDPPGYAHMILVGSPWPEC